MKIDKIEINEITKKEIFIIKQKKGQSEEDTPPVYSGK